ncbi:Hypothetical protein POVR1_LOCUS179 [uncultured virus]|nr:Hypothetical protein POVR1_LOCUS179 [uncultured virus]
MYTKQVSKKELTIYTLAEKHQCAPKILTCTQLSDDVYELKTERYPSTLSDLFKTIKKARRNNAIKMELEQVLSANTSTGNEISLSFLSLMRKIARKDGIDDAQARHHNMFVCEHIVMNR